MLEIKHKEVPRKLANRKEKGIPENPSNSWNSFNGKDELKVALTHLTFGLCAYCENRLDTNLGSHIEHILSKSLNPELTFEYTNLMLSCIQDGKVEDDTDTNPVSCGHSPLKKENNYNEELFIKPTELNVEKYFSFEVNGKIIPKAGLNSVETQKVEHTLDVLNLNCNRLTRQRHKIIVEGYEIISELKSDEEINNLISLETDKVNGKYLFSFINLRRQHFERWLK